METVVEYTGLSPSSLALYLSCNRKYFLKKIEKVDIDSDSDQSTEALDVGKAFHQVLEDTRHNLQGVNLVQVAKVCGDHGIKDDPTILMVMAMLSSYKSMHEKSKLMAINCEVEINTKSFRGFVDVILQGPNGWWIGDMKTAASFASTLVPTLPNHPQLNLYAAHYDIVAAMLDLDPLAFLGCRYRLTTKSRLKMTAKETPADYFKRLQGVIKSYDLAIPREMLNPEKILAIHGEVFKVTSKKKLAKNYPQNFGNCTQYFRACEFWSKCHGCNFSAPLGITAIES